MYGIKSISIMRYTSEQMLMILKGWQCKELLPKKGEKILVCFPNTWVNFASVQLAKEKSTYGKKLWLCIMRHVEPGELPYGKNTVVDTIG